MNCPNCATKHSNTIESCSNCGFKFNKYNWVTISKEYPPHDIIIESLLKSAGIPVWLKKKEVTGFPVAIGPLAEVKILVPDNFIFEAKYILDELSKCDQTEET